MVSLWPWKGDASSPASFEKTLSTLSTKIASNQTRLDRVRSSSRRVRVLWTLYMSFAYLVYAIVLLLVVGYHGMGVYEWTGIAGGPVLIYGTRAVLSTYFSFRIESLDGHLKELQEERAKTIQKLKDATKYDSTMELIEKYGGVGESGRRVTLGVTPDDMAGEDDERPGSSSRRKSGRHSQGPAPVRTSLPPPPTANIQRPLDASPQVPSPQLDEQNMVPGAEFAPNAEYAQPSTPITPSPYRQPSSMGPPPPPHPAAMLPETHWYDRIFDLLLGEDETAPKNRIVLICSSCRLVNGQAPPGVRSLADVGMWRCMGCGAANSEDAEDEGKRIVREVLGQKKTELGKEEEVADEPEAADVTQDGVSPDSPAASVKRRRARSDK